jgi:hypothetical protein
MTEEEFERWYNDLRVLTYGEISEEELLDYFQCILTWKREGIFISDVIPEDKFTVLEYWLLLSLLYDCIDYGSSPRGAWLTDFGNSLLDFLNAGKHLYYLEER